MQFLKKHKGKLFIFIFLLFTAFTIYDTYSMENQAENEIKTKPEITEKENIKKENKEEKPKDTKVLVDVKGEVITPGVYELTTDNTVIDAINKAGGLTKLSDTSNINLSKKLENEMVIIVYSKSEIKKMNEPKLECPPCNDACIKEEDEKAKLDNETPKDTTANNDQVNQTNTKININTATSEQLQTLDGIGEAKAKAIIDYRKKNGQFKNIEDLKNVSGIGDSVYEKIKNNITI